MINDKYRHELKYIVSDTQIKILENRIRNYMQVDQHTVDGSYNVRSLYFDDYSNSCYYQNENGTDPREKYRIRIYNCSKDRISLFKPTREQPLPGDSLCSIQNQPPVVQASPSCRGLLEEEIARCPREGWRRRRVQVTASWRI